MAPLAAALVGVVGAVLLGLAWRDAMAGYENALHVLGAYYETGGLRWETPPWGWKVRHWYEWLALTTSGHVVVSAVGSLTALSATVLFPNRRDFAAQLTRSAVACVAVLTSALFVAAGPLHVVRHGRAALARDLWDMRWIQIAAEIDALRVLGGLLLLAWVASMAVSSRAAPRMPWIGAVTVLMVGCVAQLGARPLARIAEVSVPESSYPLGRSERQLPVTPARARGIEPWERWCCGPERDCLSGYCDSPPVSQALDFEVVAVRDWAILHPSQPLSRDVPFATRSSASTAALRQWLNAFRGQQEHASILAVTVQETLVSRTSTLGEVHLGRRTIVTLPIACLDALADDVRWGEAVALCSGPQAGDGPSL